MRFRVPLSTVLLHLLLRCNAHRHQLHSNIARVWSNQPQTLLIETEGGIAVGNCFSLNQNQRTGTLQRSRAVKAGDRKHINSLGIHRLGQARLMPRRQESAWVYRCQLHHLRIEMQHHDSEAHRLVTRQLNGQQAFLTSLNGATPPVRFRFAVGPPLRATDVSIGLGILVKDAF